MLRSHGDALGRRPPSTYLTDAASGLPRGRALDAGCGHGSETLWLAARCWRVTAVDFAAAALDHGRAVATSIGPEVADRVEWIEGDLATWAPARSTYDLVLSLYVHVAGSVEEFVERLAGGVAPGGTLVLVGHRPVDLHTGEATPAAGQRQVTLDAARSVLDEDPGWSLGIAEHRERAVAGSGQDAVVVARRLPGAKGPAPAW